jgi:hypothetical protein
MADNKITFPPPVCIPVQLSSLSEGDSFCYTADDSLASVYMVTEVQHPVGEAWPTSDKPRYLVVNLKTKVFSWLKPETMVVFGNLDIQFRLP